jgi:nucleotide-binding universal stress UspA family protein
MIKPLFQKILVAVNGSTQSVHAALYAILMAKMYHCTMKAVYVVDTATLRQLTLSKFFVTEESNSYEENLCSDGTRYLNYVQDLAKMKGVKIETELRKGAVWSEIITASDEFDADVILLGGKPHESSAGTVARHDAVSLTNGEIIGSARCNVLVVKEPQIEQLFKLG